MNQPISRFPPSRLFLVDDNIRDVGGHFFELAVLLSQGASKLGYAPILATNRSFDEFESVPDDVPCEAVFRPRRMLRWSLGVDGESETRRDINGNPLECGFWTRLKTHLTDRLATPSKRPQNMLRWWSDDLLAWLQKHQPTSNDSLLINTGDDFMMLALARALEQYESPHALTVDVVFHFAVYDSHENSDEQAKRRSDFARQVDQCVSRCAPHTVRLHATTDALANQMRISGVRNPIGSIPYPTRCRLANGSAHEKPLRVVLAGLPRAEKGRAAIHDFLAAIDESLLKKALYCVSMQMPASKSRWQPMIPQSMHNAFVSAMISPPGEHNGPLEVMTENLSTADYHAWLDTADVGLFLYDPRRYVARCSGVLLEMMARGVPVIVPDQCYLSDEVEAAGGHGSIGFIYQDRDEIPQLMHQLLQQTPQIQERCLQHANRIAAKHDGANTLRCIGLTDRRSESSTQVA